MKRRAGPCRFFCLLLLSMVRGRVRATENPAGNSPLRRAVAARKAQLGGAAASIAGSCELPQQWTTGESPPPPPPPAEGLCAVYSRFTHRKHASSSPFARGVLALGACGNRALCARQTRGGWCAFPMPCDPRAGIPVFLGFARKTIRARAIKNSRFFASNNAKAALNGSQSPRGQRKNRGFAQQNPGFCAQSDVPNRAGIPGFAWLIAKNKPQKNPR